jgi:glutaredoxin-dependent peroxiredoxin
MKVMVGQPAPDFSLYDSDKQMVTLSDLKRRTILLLFFPAAFSSTCTTELCSVRDSISEYNHANATVFGISVDMVYTLVKFKEDLRLNFSLLSDFNKHASIAYDCLYDTFTFGMKGVSKRAAFIIDKAGIVRYAEVLEKAGDLPDYQAIQGILELLNN